MPIAKSTLETFVSPEELKEVILDFEKYPEFMDEVTKVEVLERSDSSITAKFHVHVAFAGFDLKSTYTTKYAITDDTVSWELVESTDISKMNGKWVFTETEDGECKADYEAELETNMAIPPEVQAAFVEESLPKLMEAFRDRAEDM
ncbi:MAG: SRPBCC family protein [Sandaracinaceae bacterium]|nr:SRPBCC family protein [Sandaracinaceae bacterium]